MSGCRFNTGNSDCDPCGPGMHQAKGLTCNYCCCEYDGAGTDLSKPILCQPKAGLIDPGVGGPGGVIGGNHNSGFTGPIGGGKVDWTK